MGRSRPSKDLPNALRTCLLKLQHGIALFCGPHRIPSGVACCFRFPSKVLVEGATVGPPLQYPDSHRDPVQLCVPPTACFLAGVWSDITNCFPNGVMWCFGVVFRRPLYLAFGAYAIKAQAGSVEGRRELAPVCFRPCQATDFHYRPTDKVQVQVGAQVVRAKNIS